MAKGRKTGGRVAGSRNKITIDLAAMIDGALEKLGGEDYLVQQGRENPQAFLGLVGKRLPKDVKLGGGLSLQVNLIGVDEQTRNQLPPAGPDHPQLP